MSYRAADVSKATGKGGMCGVEYIRRGMGLFVINAVIGPVASVSAEAAVTESRLLCFGVNNQSYFCDSGHCCGKSQCCSYYYEVWWFWLVLTLIIILGCCCVCHHRRAKHRLQQQQRQHEINLIAYREAHNYTSLPFYFRFLPGYLLPAYRKSKTDLRHPLLHTVPLNQASPPALTPCALSKQMSSALHYNPAPLPLHQRTVPQSSHILPPHIAPPETPHKPYLSLEEDEQIQQVACATSHSLVKQSSEDLTKPGEQGLDCYPDSKDKTSGRHRHFTGDSGIEVCVCSQGPGDGEEEEMKELVGHMDGGLLVEQDFCDSCNPRSSSPQGLGDEEQGLAASDGEPQQPPVCLNLHTINEQEDPRHGSKIDPQS